MDGYNHLNVHFCTQQIDCLSTALQIIIPYIYFCFVLILEHFNFTQPTLSHHMKVLIECGLVEARKCGTWNYYKISNESAKELIKFIKSITNKDNDINGSEIEQ